ncbi:hypothetical protein I4U23_004700 [Adineta vaga]|nr:hypothetical protein I4U23_004700 [Adineta vaga]
MLIRRHYDYMWNSLKSFRTKLIIIIILMALSTMLLIFNHASVSQCRNTAFIIRVHEKLEISNYLQDGIHLVLVCTGHSFNQMAISTIKSIMFHRRKFYNLTFHIFTDSDGERTISHYFIPVPDVCTKFRIYPIEKLLEIGKKFLEERRIINTHYSGIYALSKAFVHELLPLDVHRILLIDVDIMFVDDVYSIWRQFQLFNTNQTALGLAPWYPFVPTDYKYKGSNPDTFITGIVLLDLNVCRSIDFTRLLHNVTETAYNQFGLRSLWTADQVILSLFATYLSEHFITLPCFVNGHTTHYLKDGSTWKSSCNGAYPRTIHVVPSSHLLEANNYFGYLYAFFKEMPIEWLFHCVVRGRGRGTSRGRGGRGGGGGGGTSRGRGGRGATRGYFRGGARSVPPQTIDIEEQVTSTNSAIELNINADPKPFFVNANVTIDQHIQAQTINLPRYLATLFALNENSVEIGQKAKACVLAAAWCRHDHTLANNLLRHRRLFTLTEVLKAVTMLDAARLIRVYEKQLKRLELSKTKPSATKLGRVKNNIDNLNKLKVSSGSASGAIARHITRWSRTLTQQELEYFALHMPTEPWRKLADIVHFNPTKDFPALPWFLPFCFGTPAPQETMVFRCQDLTNANVNTLIIEFKIPYSHLKQFKEHLTDQSKARIASYEEKLNTILWYYEDLECPDVDVVISERLRSGEQVTLPYGKLMDRLLLIRTLRDNQPDIPTFYRNPEHSHAWGRGRTRGFANVTHQHSDQSKKTALYSDLIPAAEAQLQTIKLPLESPVVVLADASYSMEIAIRTATILSSLLTAICSAKLTFFHGEAFQPAFTPKNVEDVLTLALTTNVGGGTANAAALLPYYLEKEIVKTFIMVTDEEENESIELNDGTKTRFFKLFLKYREEVYPAKLVFISFLAHQHDLGQMYKQFLEANVPDVTQFKFNRQRPDLTKLDHLLGLLSTGSSELFDDRVARLQDDFQQNEVDTVITKLLNKQEENAVSMESEMATMNSN